MSGPVRSTEQGCATFEQWRAVCHFIEDAIPTPPTDLSKRAARSVIRHPSLLQAQIFSLFEKIELLAPWGEFYRKVVKLEPPLYDTKIPAPQTKLDDPNLYVIWGIRNASDAAQIARDVGYYVRVAEAVGPLEEVPVNCNRIPPYHYINWAQPEPYCNRYASDKSAEDLYNSGDKYADLMEVLVMIAQHYFETGMHWDPGYVTLCSIFRGSHPSYQKMRFWAISPTVKLVLDDPDRPVIDIGVIECDRRDPYLRPISLHY